MEFDKFAIGFDHRDRERLHALWEQILDTNMWSDGPLVAGFEESWRAWNGLPAVATHSWTGAALAALEFFELRGRTVLCPSNTFMASPLAIRAAGARVEFVDCNRDDLCMSFADLERKVAAHRPAAVMLVHIGGHIAFEVEEIAALCAAEGIVLIEDCAHAHGASWNGRKPGAYGDAGLWSFAPTKTISTGEGGLLVSRHPELVEYARACGAALGGGHARSGDATAIAAYLGAGDRCDRGSRRSSPRHPTSRARARAPSRTAVCTRAPRGGRASSARG